jgi:hypothetical protein
MPYADGSRGPRRWPIDDAAFAQPSGSPSIDRRSTWRTESNIIRAIALPPVNRVDVCRRLVQFGDTDGTGDAVRLQHPLGVLPATGGCSSPIPTTIESKCSIRRTAASPAGRGWRSRHRRPRRARGSMSPWHFRNHPASVADTNNHAIRRVGLADRHVSTLPILGV